MDILDRIVEAVAEKLIYMRLDELSGETLSNYVKKAEGKGKPAKGSNRHVGITRAKLKLSRAASGSNKRKNVLGSKSKGNKAYISAHKKEGSSTKPLSKAQIDQMGVRKTHDTAENDAAEANLKRKTDTLAASANKDSVRQGNQDRQKRLELMKNIHRKRQAAKAAGKKS
jgi:hypothetical protein